MADLSNNILIIKETSRTLRPTERETIKMFKKVIQEPGKMIKDMQQVNNNSKIPEESTQEILQKTDTKAKENLSINSTYMKGISKMAFSMEKLTLNTETDKYLQELLKKTSESLAGIVFQTEAFMKEHLEQICPMEEANSIGQTELNIQVTGEKVYRKVKGYKFQPTENRCQDYGRREIG